MYHTDIFSSWHPFCFQKMSENVTIIQRGIEHIRIQHTRIMLKPLYVGHNRHPQMLRLVYLEWVDKDVCTYFNGIIIGRCVSHGALFIVSMLFFYLQALLSIKCIDINVCLYGIIYYWHVQA